MGCGLDRTYPVQNGKLKNEILEKEGLILSEYAPGSLPLGYHFPYRNRLISGLCDLVVLMEAKIRSGSMTTVGHALKQGREVFAYPGDPVSPMSEGNRLLLREGARYFTKAAEILEDMNWLDNLSLILQNSDCSAKPVSGDPAEEAVRAALEKEILGFDELQQATGMAPSALMSTLTVMQIKKMINPLPGKRYQLRV
jgi:DNA processing protein